ncbi:metallophosphoesterase [Campylobacter sp. RM16189]|uniref:metallophosphoesterase n=1 Tax=Campylobacter sp. RM16189 TaxID=1705726 RepID=UPI00147275FD|nr:metallophosphoesterase [Campylobacter sp. RM16189]
MSDKLKIEYIDEDRYKRIFVFGDLHGSLHLFDEMIKKISLSKDDLVIILGDSCDRGKDSIGLYIRYTEMIKEGYSIKHIMGNHEYMFLNHYLLRGSITIQWGNNGGYETVKSIEDRNLTIKDLKWLISYIKTMPHMISSKSYLFVHAGYDCEIDEKEQDPECLMWDRSNFWYANNTGKEIYYGHTPSRDNKIKVRENGCYGMDVGAVFFDNLSIMEVKSKEVIDLGREVRER